MRTAMSSAGSASRATNAIGGEDGERAELPRQVGVGALLHRVRDVLHVVGALVGGQDLVAEHRGHRERGERDHGDDDDQHEVGASSCTTAGMDPVMFSSGICLGLTAAESTCREDTVQ